MPNPAGVVTVNRGRGFFIENTAARRLRKEVQRRFHKYISRRLVVTAAHCLPRLPPIGPLERKQTYRNLLGGLGAKKDIWARCLFVDPIADIAVLGPPDDQVPAKADTYLEFAEHAPRFKIGNARSGKGWILSLDNEWMPATLELSLGIWGEFLLIDPPAKAGTSGSPILQAGRAVGVVTGCAEVILARSLPAWLVGAR